MAVCSQVCRLVVTSIISFIDVQEIFLFCQIHCLKFKCCLWSQRLSLHPVCSDFETARRAPSEDGTLLAFYCYCNKHCKEGRLKTFDILQLCRSLSDHRASPGNFKSLAGLSSFQKAQGRICFFFTLRLPLSFASIPPSSRFKGQTKSFSDYIILTFHSAFSIPLFGGNIGVHPNNIE